MKVVLGVFYTIGSLAAASAQGLVNFANTPATPVYTQALQYNGPYSLMSAPAGSYYFELFFGVPLDGNYTPSGIYATNTGVDGLFSGGTAAVPGWAPGTSTNYFVAGWSSLMGHDFNPIWFHLRVGDFGESPVGSGIAGNGNSLPALNLFDGGGNTIPIGFTLSNTLVPEPATIALAGLGAGLVFFFQRNRSAEGQHSYVLSKPQPP